MASSSLPINNSYWVIPGRFMTGEHPKTYSIEGTKKRLNWLIELGVNSIINLTENGLADRDYSANIHEVALKHDQEIIYKRFPIVDLNIPSHQEMVTILNTIDFALSEGRNLYLHCYAGLGRTGLTVGCYLARNGLTGGKALDKVKELRQTINGDQKPSPETEEQKRMVIEWIKGQ